MGEMVKQHPQKALSAVRVRSLTRPGRYADGNGLYLVVERSGAKRWMLRTIVHGRRRDIGLGGLRLVSLAEARDEAFVLRKLARSGSDPLAERRRARTALPTFAEACRQVHADHKVAWKNSKHIAQWINTLKAYAVPAMGGVRIDRVVSADILRALSPVWLTKPETARRLRQRIGTVLDWATAAGFRTGVNPVEGIERGLPRQPERRGHHKAMPYAEVPSFMKLLPTAVVAKSVRLLGPFLVLGCGPYCGFALRAKCDRPRHPPNALPRWRCAW